MSTLFENSTVSKPRLQGDHDPKMGRSSIEEKKDYYYYYYYCYYYYYYYYY
jgi:hypothetical protein